MDPVFYAVIALVALVIVGSFLYTHKRSKAINERGIETDAVICQVKEIETETNGTRDLSYEYYVNYQNQSGQTVKAKLGNPPRLAREGMQLRVKYLPEKPKYVQMVKQ